MNCGKRTGITPRPHFPQYLFLGGMLSAAFPHLSETQQRRGFALRNAFRSCFPPFRITAENAFPQRPLLSAKLSTG